MDNRQSTQASAKAAQAQQQTQAPETTDVPQVPAVPAPTLGERFVAKVMSEFTAQMGNVKPFSDYERTLAQHLFIRIDNALREAESKRTDVNRPPYTWDNVDTKTLAPLAVNRIENGLDALLPATIYPIAYLNGRTKKYNLDLRIGYRGEMYIAKEKALEPPKDIRLELVYSTDKFKPLKKCAGRDVETYEFEITNPFKRGTIVGAFAYIVNEDATKNEVILVDMDAIEKSKKKAGNQDFWGPWFDEMVYKTLVHKTVRHIQPDPKKINAAYAEAIDENETPRFKEDQVPQEPIEGSFDDMPVGALQGPADAFVAQTQEQTHEPVQAAQGGTGRRTQQAMQFGENPGF